MSADSLMSQRQQKIAVISSDPKFISRAQAVGRVFNAQIHQFVSADQYSESEKLVAEMSFVIISAVEAKNQSETAGTVQAVKFMTPKCPIAVVVEKKVKAEEAVFIKKSGANVVLLEDEYLMNTKIDFFVARYLHGEWVAIKSYELIAGVPLTFSVNHLMPLNQRMLAIVQPGQSLTKEKLDKFNTVGEFYIHRDQLDSYVKLLKEHNDQSAAGLKRRCRAVFMNFVKIYKDLVLLLTDQSEAASYKEGSELFQKLTGLSSEVMTQLGATGEAWDVINNTSLEDFTPVDRSSAIAAYAGLLSLMSGIGKPEDVMMSALIADLGLLDMAPGAADKIRRNQIATFSEEERKDYSFHPMVSVNKVLSRKLPIPEHLKNIVLCSHENFCLTGFPNKIQPEKIPEESYLLQLCELLDQMGLVEFGKTRKNPLEVRKDLIERELQMKPLRFPPDFLQKIKNSF